MQALLAALALDDGSACGPAALDDGYCLWQRNSESAMVAVTLVPAALDDASASSSTRRIDSDDVHHGNAYGIRRWTVDGHGTTTSSASGSGTGTRRIVDDPTHGSACGTRRIDDGLGTPMVVPAARDDGSACGAAHATIATVTLVPEACDDNGSATSGTGTRR